MENMSRAVFYDEGAKGADITFFMVVAMGAAARLGVEPGINCR